MALLGSVGTAGRLAFRPLKAGVALYGSSVWPQPEPSTADTNGAAHTINEGATRRTNVLMDVLRSIGKFPDAPAPGRTCPRGLRQRANTHAHEIARPSRQNRGEKTPSGHGAPHRDG